MRALAISLALLVSALPGDLPAASGDPDRSAMKSDAIETLQYLIDRSKYRRVRVLRAVQPGSPIREGIVYDAIGREVDWDKGYSTLSIATRKAGVEASDFPAKLAKHVRLVADAFGGKGLQGYLVIASPRFGIAIQNWQSKQAMEKLLASPEGAKVQDAGAQFMTSEHFGPHESHPGTLALAKSTAK
jgi:hypothetical protein